MRSSLVVVMSLAFAGTAAGDPPAPPAPPAPPVASAPAIPTEGSNARRLDAGSGLLVVCGDAELVSDDFSGGPKDITKGVTRVWGGTHGFPFVVDLVAWMTGSADTLAIRASDRVGDAPVQLSDPARRVIARLDRVAKISVYWGETMPTKTEPSRRHLETFLREVVTAGHGHVEVDWVKMDASGRAEAAKRGVHEDSFAEVEANQLTQTKAFHGLVVEYGGRTELVGPLVEVRQDAQDFELASRLEFDVCAAFDKLSRPTKAVVGLARSAPPPSVGSQAGVEPDDKRSVLKQLLAKEYGADFRDAVDLESSVAPDVVTLIVAAPRKWSERQTYHLEQFVLRGGRALLLLDAVSTRDALGDEPPAPKSGLEDWLASLGVSAPPGAVGDLDARNQGAAATRDGLTGYPFFVKSLREELNQDCPATHGVESVPFYFPSEILVDDAKQVAAGRRVTVLATTSAKGFLQTDVTTLASAKPSLPAEKEMGRKTLLVAIDGPFRSFWKGKSAPDDPAK